MIAQCHPNSYKGKNPVSGCNRTNDLGGSNPLLYLVSFAAQAFPQHGSLAVSTFPAWRLQAIRAWAGNETSTYLHKLTILSIVEDVNSACVFQHCPSWSKCCLPVTPWFYSCRGASSVWATCFPWVPTCSNLYRGSTCTHCFYRYVHVQNTV